MSKDMNDLQVIRLTSPDQAKMIPRGLIDQFKDEEWDMPKDAFYEMAALSLQNPQTLMYVMHDTEVIQGFIWLEYSLWEQRLKAHMLVVDRDYQRGALKPIFEFALKVREDLESEKPIQFVTYRPKPYIKAGCGQSKLTVLELNGV